MVTESKMDATSARSFLEPLVDSFTSEVDHKFSRADISYDNLSSRFLLWGRQDLNRQQYCSLYSARLEEMRPMLAEKAKTSFGK